MAKTKAVKIKRIMTRVKKAPFVEKSGYVMETLKRVLKDEL